MIKGKILKHKTLTVETYGVPLDGPEGIEIYQTDTPELFPTTCTMKGLLMLHEGQPAEQQLKDYDLVSVEVVEVGEPKTFGWSVPGFAISTCSNCRNRFFGPEGDTQCVNCIYPEPPKVEQSEPTGQKHRFSQEMAESAIENISLPDSLYNKVHIEAKAGKIIITPKSAPSKPTGVLQEVLTNLTKNDSEKEKKELSRYDKIPFIEAETLAIEYAKLIKENEGFRIENGNISEMNKWANSRMNELELVNARLTAENERLITEIKDLKTTLKIRESEIANLNP